jgi:DNA-binding NtrC family response regulator
VVVLIPLGDLAAMAAALRAGAYATLATPLPAPDAAIPLIERAAERRRLAARVRALEEQVAEHDQLGPIVAGSPRMNELLRRAAAAAASSAPVLVIGEPGTGRASLARFIHRRSNRARAPLVVWNPAGMATGGPLPAEDAASAGLAAALAEAEGGTLVLADLGAVPPSAQAYLASALARQEPSRPRVVATAEPSVRDQVARDVLREDLFYRLAAVLLEVPPLRRRREDIPLLAYHFLSRYAAREGKKIRRVSPDALRALREHAWPGNVRELENAIEYAAVMARGDAILRADLPLARPESDPDEEVGPVALAGSDVLELPYGEAKERAVAAFDVAYVERRMKRTAGNVSEAARLAGMDRSNFRRLLKKVREEKSRGSTAKRGK